MKVLVPILVPLAIAPSFASRAEEDGRLKAVAIETLTPVLDCGTGGLEVDAQGFVYCSDFGSKLGAGGTGGTKVFKVDPTTGKASVFLDGLRGASGNAFGPDGSFYQSNIGGGFVTRVSPDGKADVFVARDLSSPVGIVVDEEGTVFVANCGAASITEITPEGGTAVFAKDPLLSCPNGLTLDDEHNFYVANFQNGDVVRVSWTGEVSRLATLPGKNNGHLVHHEGDLYVVARSDHRIYRVTLDGDVEVFAGSGKRGSKDGPALEAELTYPNDLAFSPDGKYLYVNEPASTTAPHTELAPTRIRRIRLSR